MSGKDSGGPAFPVVGMKHIHGQEVIGVFQDGMTLRDYFAAKAMQSVIINMDFRAEGFLQRGPDVIADSAYKFADAMLAARKQGDGK